MKKLLSILSLAILISSCSDTKERISFDKVTIVDDVYYLKADMSLVTGIVTQAFENGQLEMEANFKDGELDGLVKLWYDNGQLEEEGNFKDGKKDGLFKTWDENGQLELEVNYKDGVLIE